MRQPRDDSRPAPVTPALVQVSPPLEFRSALWGTLPGRIVLVTTAILAVLVLAGQVFDLPLVLDLFRRVAWISWLVGSAWLAGIVISRNRRAFLWRVRRKLLLSYVFLGVVPVVLIVAFVLAAGVLLYVTVAAYVFRESYGDSVELVRQIAETSAVEIGRTPTLAETGLERRYDNLRANLPELSLALVPAGGSANARPGRTDRRADVLVAGAWRHLPPPETAPEWVRERGFAGTFVVPRLPADGGPQLIIRAAVMTADGSRLAVADLPVDAAFIGLQQERTGITMTSMVPAGCGVDVPATTSAGATSRWSMFRETVVFVDCVDWTTGTPGRVAINLDAPLGGLYARLAALNPSQLTVSLSSWASVLLQLLWMLGFLFLIIQGSAIVMGAVLAKSITSAVHELFDGTERIQRGDFAHRIRIDSHDQLGDLAISFNRMSESVEKLLHVQREKQRLDDELRIAREIQKSLLPVRPPSMVGLGIADLCEAAREVGGDYYDFFELSPHELGVMIADVSGKGTSAALYMAELKGIVLALSQGERSPRNLLIRVNQLLAGHLDNRSFITMTYAVIDLHKRTLTMARAGHTPMVLVSGGRSEIVTPDGMVLGLRLPGAEMLFERLLEEHVTPLAPGDVVVFYTDGITEAMDVDGELFGDDRLAQVLRSQHELSAAGLRERVLREVRAFVGEAEAHDDMTMVVLKVGDETPGMA